MNIELKPIAESKVRQLGGDVCGVLVRTQASEVMAVSEHGRCTRLDAGVMGPVETETRESLFSERDLFLMKEAMNAGQYYESLDDWLGEVISDGGHTVEQYLAHDADQKQADRAQGGQGADVVAWECSGEPGLYDNITRSKGEADHHRKIGRTVRPLVYGDTQPQPAVPEEWREVLAGCVTCFNYPEWSDKCEEYERRARELLSTPTTPQADGCNSGQSCEHCEPGHGCKPAGQGGRVMETSKVYFDSEGNECSIWQMVKREPTWAAVRIQEGEKAIDEITTLSQQLTSAQSENEALKARVADAINCLDTVSGKAELGASVVRAERTEAMSHVAEGFDVIKRYAKTEAQRLREQADEAERAGGER